MWLGRCVPSYVCAKACTSGEGLICPLMGFFDLLFYEGLFTFSMEVVRMDDPYPGALKKYCSYILTFAAAMVK